MSSVANPVANMPEFLQSTLGQEYSRLVSANDETRRLAQIRQLTERALEPIRRRMSRPDVLQMPSNGTRVSAIGSIALPINGATDILVLSYHVPVGHAGYINFVSNQYAGQSFAEGSGDLTWAVRFGNANVTPGLTVTGLGSYPFYSYSAITTSLGSLQNPQWAVGGGLPIRENQYIIYTVSVASAAIVTPGGRIVCSLLGWIAPL
jgi:hypothetical protein